MFFRNHLARTGHHMDRNNRIVRGRMRKVGVMITDLKEISLNLLKMLIKIHFCKRILWASCGHRSAVWRSDGLHFSGP